MKNETTWEAVRADWEDLWAGEGRDFSGVAAGATCTKCSATLTPGTVTMLGFAWNRPVLVCGRCEYADWKATARALSTAPIG